MAETSESSPAGVSEGPIWQTESIRISIFGTIAPKDWKDIIGEEPQQSMRQAPPLPSFDAGPFNGMRLTIVKHLNQCDVTLAPDPVNYGDTMTTLMHIGDLSTASDFLIPVVKKALREDVISNRVAIGAVLLHQTESLNEASEAVKTFLPMTLPDNSVDVSLQINIPKTFKIQSDNNREIAVNRLVTWQTVFVQVVNMLGGSGIPNQVVGATAVPAIRLSIDVNTPAGSSLSLNYDQVSEIVDKLAAEARAIAKVGGFPR